MESCRLAYADRWFAVPTAQPLALLIGFRTDEHPYLGAPFARARCERMPYALLHAALACAPTVDCIVSPLVTEQFDAMELAAQLALGGYRGRYVVVTPALPDPRIIAHELQHICPDVKVELLPRARN